MSVDFGRGRIIKKNILGHGLRRHGGDAARSAIHGCVARRRGRHELRERGCGGATGGEPRTGGGAAREDAPECERAVGPGERHHDDAARPSRLSGEGRAGDGSAGGALLLDRGGAPRVERGSRLGHGRGESWAGQRDTAPPRPDALRSARSHGRLGVGPQLAAEAAAAVIQARRRPSAVATGEQRYGRERERMVAEQLVSRGIADPAVLEAMRNVPRHLFVDEALRDRAYGDHPLPIGDAQTISQPFIVARMTELLRLTGREKVLEIGTGSGYQAAVLSRLAARVCSIERIPKLAARARQALEAIGASNVWVRTADGTMGWADEAPFDRILVAAGGPSVPPPLVDQLAEGGRLVMPVGPEDAQRLRIVDKQGGQTRESEDSGCVFVKLISKYAWEA